MISKNIKDLLLEKARNQVITDLRIGLAYTYIELNSNNAGVAYTPKFLSGKTCCSSNQIGILIGKSADKSIELLGSNNLYASSIGLATANALANYDIDNLSEGDILDVITIKPDDFVVMAGYFAPLVTVLQQKAKKLVIVEKEKKDNCLTADQLSDIMPDCNVAIITATSIIDNSIDACLELTDNCREVVILGPSTPLLPGIFAKKSVTALSGMQIIDKERMKQLISHGCGTRSFKESVKKVVLKI